MNHGCPNIHCKIYNQKIFQVKDGFFYRHEDARKIQRFRCKICQKKYSSTTSTLEYRQKKRRINLLVFKLLSTGNSMRNCARILNVSRHTIDRKLVYLSKKMLLKQEELKKVWLKNPVQKVQFDDLITSIHTKLKPVAVCVVVCKESYMILDAQVSQIPAFGKLAKISRKKYGRRQNLHTKSLDSLLSKISPLVHSSALIETDEHKMYPSLIKKHFPKSVHKTFKAQRASIVGMGELKNKSFDPLFAINQTLAQFRYGINRLIRRTWCTTKDIKKLQEHINIFIAYHNERKLQMK